MIREPQFSDHAILRFIERDAGVDVAGFRHRMAKALATPGAQRNDRVRRPRELQDHGPWRDLLPSRRNGHDLLSYPRLCLTSVLNPENDSRQWCVRPVGSRHDSPRTP